MKLIFAIDKNWSIGINGDMLFHIRKDLGRFREITTGNILVMGRKTLESLPGGKPLPNRTSIVLTRSKDYEKEGAIIVHSIHEMDEKINELNVDQDKEVFLIGGGDLVAQLIDRCSYAYITKVNRTFTLFDTFIPNLDQRQDWEIESVSGLQREGDLEYRYINYRKRTKPSTK